MVRMNVRTDSRDTPPGWPVHTVASEPPASRARSESGRGWWPAALAECRELPGEWRMVNKMFTEKTARQLASDIRRAHARTTIRVVGVLPGDRWEAIPGQAPEEEGTDSYRLWLRYIGPSSPTSGSSMLRPVR